MKIATKVIFMETKNINREITIIKITAPKETGVGWRGSDRNAILRRKNEINERLIIIKIRKLYVLCLGRNQIVFTTNLKNKEDWRMHKKCKWEKSENKHWTEVWFRKSL